MTKSTPYTPISCTFYDRLEAWAVKGELLVMEYRNNDGQLSQIQTRIEDLQARQGVEYAVLENGLELRLDQLVTVNGLSIAP